MIQRRGAARQPPQLILIKMIRLHWRRWVDCVVLLAFLGLKGRGLGGDIKILVVSRSVLVGGSWPELYFRWLQPVLVENQRLHF